MNKLVMTFVGHIPWNPCDAALGQKFMYGLKQDGSLYSGILVRDHVGHNSFGPLRNKIGLGTFINYVMQKGGKAQA